MRSIHHLVLGPVLGAALAAGCTASGEEVKPPDDQLFFPTGLAVSPDGQRLFAVNANSDLRYDSGSVVVLPVPDLEAVITPWVMSRTITGDCRQDPDFTETLICQAGFFLGQTRDAGVRIGNFATDMALQDLGNGALRLVIPTRGDPSITWADWDPAATRLSCNASGRGFELCDEVHRLTFVLGDADNAPVPSEPFGAFADSAGEFAMVTHLTSGAITLIDSPRDGDAVVTDIAAGYFTPDPTTGRASATSVAGRTPHQPDDIVYVGSRTDDRIQTFTVGRPVNDAAPFLLDGSWFHLDGVGNNNSANGASTDTRGMAFSPTGDRLYLVNRRPPSLQIIDTAIGPTGFPNHALIGATDICRQASTVAVVNSGDGERAFVTCFQDGQVYAIDPRGGARVEDNIIVGRGPYAAVAAPDGKWLYVSNFLEDTIAVIDLRPGSPMRHRVVLRIGEPRSL